MDLLARELATELAGRVVSDWAPFQPVVGYRDRAPYEPEEIMEGWRCCLCPAEADTKTALAEEHDRDCVYSMAVALLNELDRQ